MFLINEDGSIFLTRGDIAVIDVRASKSDESEFIFKYGDVIRLKIFEKKRCDSVVLSKYVVVEDDETSVVTISLDKDDTKIGEVINKPKDYWYEIELNPETQPQTIIGYDSNGPKIFRLFPEGVMT